MAIEKVPDHSGDFKDIKAFLDKGKPKAGKKPLSFAAKAKQVAQSKVMNTILERVAVLDKMPMANLIHKQLEVVKLEEDFKGEVTLIEDKKTGDFFLETEVPPLMEYDEVTGKLVCEDAATARLVQMASGGDPKEIQRICESKEVRLKILSDESGQIRFKLMAHLLDRVMKEPAGYRVDPIKHVLNMIQDQRGGRTRDANGRYEKLTPAKSWTDDRGQQTEAVRRELLGMAGEGKSGRKKQG